MSTLCPASFNPRATKEAIFLSSSTTRTRIAGRSLVAVSRNYGGLAIEVKRRDARTLVPFSPKRSALDHGAVGAVQKQPTNAGRLLALTELLLRADCQDVRNDSVAVGGPKICPMRHRIDNVRPILGSIMAERR